jgi:phosphohistidine phosphatase
VVTRLSPSADAALLIGHNPGFEELVGRLSGNYQPMPTAGLACLQFSLDNWLDIDNGLGRLVWLLTPA